MSRRSHIKRAKTLRNLWPNSKTGAMAAYAIFLGSWARKYHRLAHAIRSAYPR